MWELVNTITNFNPCSTILQKLESFANLISDCNPIRGGLRVVCRLSKKLLRYYATVVFFCHGPDVVVCIKALIPQQQETLIWFRRPMIGRKVF